MTSQGLEDAMENFLAQLQCAICLCTYDSPYSLPCNHCFCEQCIHRALELKPCCPICKAPTRKRNLRPDPTINKLLSAVDLFNTNTPNYKKSPAFHGIKNIPNLNPSQFTLTGNTTMMAVSDNTPGGSSYRSRGNSKKRQTPTSSSSSRAELSKKKKSSTPSITTSTPKSTKPTTKKCKKKQQDEDSEDSEESEYGEKEEKDDEQEEVTPRGPVSGTKRKLHTPPAPVLVPKTTPTTTSTSKGIVQKFLKGQLVEVMSRTWTGINKPGGFAWITHVNEDGTFNVKYILDNRKEKRVSSEYFKYVPDEIISDTTPGRSVKNRQRKLVSSWETSTLLSTDAARMGLSSSKNLYSGLVFLCSGFSARTMTFITKWAETLHAQVVSEWSPYVTHLIVRCVPADADQMDTPVSISKTTNKSTKGPHKRELFPSSSTCTTASSTCSGDRWVKIRSLKYLKALVAGCWVVSEAWLQACAKQGKHVSEADYEADGHLKGQHIHDAVRRSRQRREKWLQVLNKMPSSSSLGIPIGTRLFKNFCFFLAGEFLPPMPPTNEIDTLLGLGEGHVIRHEEDLNYELEKPIHKEKVLVIVCDKINDRGLEEMAERFLGNTQSIGPLARVQRKAVVSYQWVLDSISEAQLIPFKYSHDELTDAEIDIVKEEARQDAKEEALRQFAMEQEEVVNEEEQEKMEEEEDVTLI